MPPGPPSQQSIYPAPNAGVNPYQHDAQDWNVKVPINPSPGLPSVPANENEHIYEIPPGGPEDFPKFPEPPTDFHKSPFHKPGPPNPKPGEKGDDLDFDDLARRFDELKKKL